MAGQAVRAVFGIWTCGGQRTPMNRERAARPTIRDFRNYSRKFMAEDGGRHDHFGVITAFENLEVRAAGERGFDADADFARFERGRRDVFNLNVFFAVQDGGFHAHSLCAGKDKAKQSF
jgi:hypothetical protein